MAGGFDCQNEKGAVKGQPGAENPWTRDLEGSIHGPRGCSAGQGKLSDQIFSGLLSGALKPRAAEPGVFQQEGPGPRKANERGARPVPTVPPYSIPPETQPKVDGSQYKPGDIRNGIPHVLAT
jgi:hypothetical protein